MKAAVASRSRFAAANGSDRSAAERRSYSTAHDTACPALMRRDYRPSADRTESTQRSGRAWEACTAAGGPSTARTHQALTRAVFAVVDRGEIGEIPLDAGRELVRLVVS